MQLAHYFMTKEIQQTELAVQRYNAAVVNTQLCYRQAKATTLSAMGTPGGLGVAFGLGCVSGLEHGKARGTIESVFRALLILV
ncbi:hypothetical protein [Neptunicella sp. SCSIO 80796]|uniref:hypothetical protein n=1 Tax=Neptunicella plasticusilytica TaxID=3117012 RepID=UPI003A4D25C7